MIGLGHLIKNRVDIKVVDNGREVRNHIAVIDKITWLLIIYTYIHIVSIYLAINI